MIKLFFVYSFIFCLLIFKANKSVAFWIPSSSTNQISSLLQFEKLAGAPLETTFSKVKSVKIVYDVKRKEIYYLNSKIFSLHFDFCENILKYPFGLETFNEENYSNHRNRNYLLSTLNYFEDSQKYGLEFFADNVINVAQLNELYSKINHSTFIGDSLKIMLNSENMIHLVKQGSVQLPTLTINDIYANQQFQSIKKGIAYGYLRFFNSTKDIVANQNDIVVVNGSPLQIPNCKAIITNNFQTPLSHIQVITQHRNIPSCAIKNIFQNQSIIGYKDKAVKIEIDNDSMRIIELTAAEIEKHIGVKLNYSKLKKLTFDTINKGILLIKNIRSSHSKSIGNKAFQFSELYDLSVKNDFYFHTPEAAFCLPFYYYKNHIQNEFIATEIEKLKGVEDNDSLIKDQLKIIRSKIKQMPIDSNFLNKIMLQLKGNSSFTTFRFRSSSNAEDLYEFCGAGLYDSYTGDVKTGKIDIEKAIKKVWASVYNYRAYKERRLYNIDEETVMMGVLVHRSFPKEKSNGVVITKNIYRNDYPGFVINAQFGDVSVVRPPDNIVCEQIICNATKNIHSSEKKLSVKYICKSNLQEGNVLSTQELEKLYSSVDLISQYYYRKTAYIDIEFKFDENGQLYIKQVRPYK
jgi:pyruvate,water dikinase